jgi:hypothetical protein
MTDGDDPKNRELTPEEEETWIDMWVRAGERRREEIQAAIRRAEQQGIDRIQAIEDRRTLGQRVLTALRGQVAGEPGEVEEKASQWWFMLGWVTRGCAVGIPEDDELRVIEAFAQFTLGTGESRRTD